MDPSKPETNPTGANRPQPPNPPPIRYDLAAMLKENPHLCRILGVFRADLQYLGLVLSARAAFDFCSFPIVAIIECVNAVDYSVHPANPATLMGGPLMEFHEEHPLLAEVSQCVPNSDGMETYDPPVKFAVLVMDQTHVIAGQFALRIDHGNMFKNVVGWDEQKRNRCVADLQRGLQWMEPFRLMQMKRFPTRTLR